MAPSALASLDNAKLSFFHVKSVLIAGTGFLTDAYDLFIINLVVPMVAYAYYDGHIDPAMEGMVKGSAAWGTLIGQLFFGILADRVGRKKMYGSELLLIIFATICSAMSCSTLKGMDVLVMLSIWRFILGIGIGGDYPLSAVITSEISNVNSRGMMISAVFAMQGVGILLASLVSVVTLAAFKTLIEEDVANVDYVWRICLGFGAVPAVLTIYFRLTMSESPRYTAHVLHDAEAANAAVKSALTTGGEVEEHHKTGKETLGSWKDFSTHFGQWRNLKVLLGCSISWFVLDVAFYGLNLNQSSVLDSIGWGNQKDATPFEDLWSKALGNLIIACMGTVPGYWPSVFLIDHPKLGRKPIQYMGFAVLTVCMLVLALCFNILPTAAFLAVYTLAMFFFNFGPNTTTFVIPGEVFPTRYRSTGHGISAASGKAGAILASQAFPPLKKVIGIQALLGIFSVFMAIGIYTTSWLPETRGRTLEDLAGEEDNEEDIEEMAQLRDFEDGFVKDTFA